MCWYTLYLFNNRILLHRAKKRKREKNIEHAFPPALALTIELDQISLSVTNPQLEFTNELLLTFNYFFEEEKKHAISLQRNKVNTFFFSCCDMLIRLPNKIENKEFHSIRSNRVESWDEQKSHSLSNIKSHFTVLLRKHYHTKTSKYFVCIQNTLFKSDITKYKSFKYQLNAMMMAWPASGCSSCVTTSNEKEIFNAIHELRQQL